MAEAGRLTAVRGPWLDAVNLVRIVIVGTILVTWELVAASGLLYRDVVPSLVAIGKAVAALLADHEYYWHLAVTAGEVGTGLAIGGLAGLVAGILIGANRLLQRAFEPYLYYLGPTPK